MSTEDQTIYPDVSIEEWIEKYPSLAGTLGCVTNCDAVRVPIKAWYSKDLAGVETGPCPKCDRPAAFKYVYTNEVKNRKMLNMFKEFTGT